jgi:hypothetical protein
MSSFVSNAILWKNGVAQTLSSDNSQARDVFISGTDVYVVGQAYNGETYVNNAVVWKNGVLETVSTDNSQGWGVYVSGSDVYVAGLALDANWKNSATLWKNGVAQTLATGGNSIYAYDVCVSGSDVYVAGCTSYSGGEYDGDNRPALWKNGELQTLEEIDEADDWVSSGYARAVAVSDGNVYVAGRQMYYNTMFKKATAWTNGTAQMLSNNISDAYSVCIHRGNVYVAGDAQNSAGVNVATLWKNGQIYWQSDDESTSSATCVVVK